MSEHVLSAIVWGVLALTTSGLVGCLVGAVLAFVGIKVDRPVISVVGIALGWIAGVTWFIICVVNCVTSVVNQVNMV